MITRYQMEMVEGGKYDNAEWVRYTEYLELEQELYDALTLIDRLEAEIQEYAENQPPI